MDDHGAADDLLDGETVGENSGKGVSLVAEEGRKVAAVIGMRALIGIVMAHYVGEGVCLCSRAGPAGMDVERKERAGLTFCRGVDGKPGDIGHNDDPAFCLVKGYRAHRGSDECPC